MAHSTLWFGRILPGFPVKLLRIFPLLGYLVIVAAPPVAEARFTPFTWIGTWSAAPHAPIQGVPTPEFNNQTLRLIVHISSGGPLVRLKLSNAYGTAPLQIGDVHVAISTTAAGILAGSDSVVTFAGQNSVTIPPGGLVMSDPVNLVVSDFTNLAVSIYLPADTIAVTQHFVAQQASYISSPGDFTGSSSFPISNVTLSWYFLSNVEVLGFVGSRAVVALGDSITDGVNSSFDGNTRWPDVLAQRLASFGLHQKLSVLNQGIDGNQLVNDYLGIGQNGDARFDRDVIAQAGAKYVIVLEGTNDIGLGLFVPAQAAGSAGIIAGYNQLIQRAHEHDIMVFGGTLIPFGGSFYYTAATEAERQAVNQFIRTGQAFDGVIDFDLAVRDPNNPTQILPAYDSGDHLHPNDAGYRAMGQSINLSLFNPF
jgi:lysophospholipase L1-like esterase